MNTTLKIKSVVLKWLGRSLLLSAFGLLAALPVCPAFGAGSKTLPGHVRQEIASLGLRPIARLGAAEQLHLAISVPLRDPAGLSNFLAEVYNPASLNFHHFLTPAEFTARFSATEADYAAVVNFALTNGFTITGGHSNRMLLEVTARTGDVERAFRLKLNRFRHPREARDFFAADADPTIDATLPILHVSGLNNYSLPHRVGARKPAVLATPQVGSSGDGSYLANDLRAAYAPGVSLTGAGQNVGLVQFSGYDPADITKYISDCGITTSAALVNVPINGGSTGRAAEVALDIEMILAMAPGVSKVAVYEGPNPTAWESILSALADDSTLKQISCSWTGGAALMSVDPIFQRMAAQGQSFFQASGDDGASDGFCECGSDLSYPSDSPNVTSVGGTTLATANPQGGYGSESAWSGSSGGVSSYFPIPWYQQGVSMSGNSGSTARRNVPDVAILAQGIYEVFGGVGDGGGGGTSAAAPLWAGFAALVNQQVAGVNGPNASIGFINPAIYSIAQGSAYASCFHDVTTGNNRSSSFPNVFDAVTGYDLCTGWGSPNGQNLIDALAAWPKPTGLTATAANGQVILSWNSTGGATSYTLRRLTAGGSSYTFIVTIPSSSGATYTDSTVVNGTTYYYVVSENYYNNGTQDTVTANSSPSGPVTPEPSPAAPTGLSGLSGNNQVALSWTSVSGATGYQVQRSLSGGGPYTTIANSTGVSYTDLTAVGGTVYYYVVLAINVDVPGPISSQVTVTPTSAYAWTTVNSMVTARKSAMATLLPNGQVLVAGGQGVSGTLASAESYSQATGLWTSANPMSTARAWATVTLLPSGQVLVAGGQGGSGSVLATAELYNPATGLWTSANPMSNARAYATATLLTNGQVLVAGGGTGQFYDPDPIGSAELFNPASGTWTLTGSLSTTRQGHTATLLPNGQVLVSGGYGAANGGFFASAELYNPVTGKWTPTGSLNVSRAYASATLLPNGLVLVAGGSGPSGAVASAELYNPATGQWKLTANPMHYARYMHAATLLPNGLVLVEGGGSGGSFYAPGAISSSELFDPAAGTWTVTGSLNTAREFHTATLLPNGSVLAVGGQGVSSVLSSAEVSNPVMPMAPLGLSTQPGNNQVVLSWNSVAGATSYNVKRSTTLGGSYTVIASPGGTSYTDNAVANGTVYYYLVSAVNAYGQGPNSNPIGPVTPEPALAAPSGLSAVAGNNQVVLSWNSVSGATSYNVQRSIFTGGPYTTIASPTGTGFTDVNALNGTAYYYVVSAVNVDVPGSISSQVGPVTPQQPSLPAAPTGLSVVPGNRQVVLSWNSVAGATSYRVRRSSGSTGPWTIITSVTGTTYTDGGLVNDTIYYYVVSAVNGNGEGPGSGSSATPETVPAAPTGLTAQPGNYTIILAWNIVSGANYYIIQRNPGIDGPDTEVIGIVGVDAVTFTDNTAYNGNLYYYTVTAIHGDVYSNPSWVYATAGPLPAPTGLTVKPGNAEVLLSWNGTSGATKGYNVKRATAAAGPYQTIASYYTLATYTDRTAANGTPYYYKVSAVNLAGEGNNSAVAGPVTPGTWLSTGLLNAGRENATATLLPNGSVLITGGDSGYGPLATAELYNPTTGHWTLTGSMSYARENATATLLPNGLVLVAGGQGTGGPLAYAELYNPATGVWTTTGSLNNARVSASATMLPNGLVLVAGGYGASGPLTSAELYNPATGLWTLTGSMSYARDTFTSTLLPNGLVLVAGGINSGGSYQATAELYTPATGLWTTTHAMNIARDLHTATLLPTGLVLVTGGYGPSGVLTSAELYNPATGLWAATGSMTQARFMHTATLLPNGLVLVGGGGGGSYTAIANAEVYNPATGTWAATDSLISARELHTATLLPNGQVLFAGGVGSGGYTNSISELYNPAPLSGTDNTWVNTGSLNVARYLATATLMPNGSVLVAGGDGGSGPLDSAEVYNPATAQWTLGYSMTYPREAATATLLPNGSVLVAGGGDASSELYNPATGLWSLATMNYSRQNATATLLPNGLVLVAGGDAIGSAELYNPATGAWTATGTMQNVRSWHTATLLPNGSVLVAGGSGSSGFLNTAELYNPATGLWTLTGSIGVARAEQTATLLPSGLVLIAGGISGSGTLTLLANASLYNPATGIWTSTGLMNTVRYEHPATLLRNGLVLIAGGTSPTYDSEGIRATELFNPATGTWTVTGSLNTGRFYHTTTVLPNGSVLATGGLDSNGYVTGTAELFSPAMP